MDRHERQIAPEPVFAAHLPPFTVASRRAPFAAVPVALPEFFEEHAERLELWSPGYPLFTPPKFIKQAGEPPAGRTLTDILDG